MPLVARVGPPILAGRPSAVDLSSSHLKEQDRQVARYSRKLWLRQWSQAQNACSSLYWSGCAVKITE